MRILASSRFIAERNWRKCDPQYESNQEIRIGLSQELVLNVLCRNKTYW